MKINDVFNTFIDSIESNSTLNSFREGLYDTELIKPSFHLGSGDAKTELKRKIDQVNLNDDVAMKSLKISALTLSDIYLLKQKRVNRVLYFCLITIGIAIALIMTGLILAFVSKSQARLGIITSTIGILPGFFSGTSFWLYRNENSNLKPVERDMRKMAMMQTFFQMAQFIDEKKRANALDDMARQLSKPMEPVKRILFLAANPKTTSRLRLDEEMREIEESIKLGSRREQFEIRSVWAVRYRDLRRAMLNFEPHIVHFSGHGQEDSIILEDLSGFAETVSPESISGLFKLCATHVECVILNACYSEIQAEAIKEHIQYVIGMQHEIKDKAALEFAVGFYDSLGAGKSIEDAFEFGCNAVLQTYPDLQDHLIPVLKQKNG